MMHYGWYGGMYMWLIFLMIAAAAMYLLFKRGKNVNRMMTPPGENPLDILKRRYAKGEITKEEYDRLKKDIEDDRR